VSPAPGQKNAVVPCAPPVSSRACSKPPPAKKQGRARPCARVTSARPVTELAIDQRARTQLESQGRIPRQLDDKPQQLRRTRGDAPSHSGFRNAMVACEHNGAPERHDEHDGAEHTQPGIPLSWSSILPRRRQNVGNSLSFRGAKDNRMRRRVVELRSEGMTAHGLEVRFTAGLDAAIRPTTEPTRWKCVRRDTTCDTLVPGIRYAARRADSF
jgi:hypothetical protein